jgi:hypothetical protein
MSSSSSLLDLEPYIPDKIKEFNSNLLSNNINVNIIDYVKHVGEKIEKIDVSFSDDLLKLLNKPKNLLCIHHNYLSIYEIYDLSKGSNVVEKSIINNKTLYDDFKEGTDYIKKDDGIFEDYPPPSINDNNDNENPNPPIGGFAKQLHTGGKSPIHYYFTPLAFGFILMRATNGKKYARYYQLILDCMIYYKEYQLRLEKTETQG